MHANSLLWNIASVKYLQFLWLCALFLSGSVYPATYQEAVKAYKEGKYESAAQIWGSLANLGDARSQRELAFMYQQGKGIQQDYKKAVFWYTKAAENGNQSAQFNLATMYRFGKGVIVDGEKAAQWYLAAASSGHEWAQLELGTLYRSGEGVSKNYNTAFFWFSLSAIQGNKRAEKYKYLVHKKISSNDILLTEKLIKDCVLKNFKNCQNP